ncbi:putative inorganic phosphate cotransporter isoform X2 [Tachypleus tridentatus]|uniref:putative inorganic phosphate cotransporter isoform X2 n=1 Tax=Tachypleus tridentatus TaxID=6853 RepID=UPI003FD11AAB
MTVKTNSFAESLNETTKLLAQRNTLSTEKRSIEPTDDEKQPLILTTNSKASCGECIRARYVLVIFAFINFVNSYTVRVNLNVAIVAMVNYTAIHHDQLWTTECPNSEGIFNSNSTIEKEGEFIWDEYTQGIILGCFYFGYLITNLFGGTLAKRFGDKRVFGLGILLSSVLTLLTPLSLQLPIGVFIVKRIVEGLGQGVMNPAMQSLLARWIPKSEMGLTCTIVYNGAQIGTLVTMPLTGVLSNSDFLGGWPSAFYVFGAITCVSSIFWILFVHDFPSDHPRISKQELLEIEAEKGIQNNREMENKSIPWRQILTSFPVWAVIIAHYGNSWGFYTILIDLPTYLKNILHFDIEQNGFLSALPYLCQFAIGCLAGYAVDLIYRKKWFRVTVLRKISNSFGFYGSALCLTAVTLADCNHALAVTILALSMGFNGFIFPGFFVVGVDMAPNYAGVLMGLSNGISQLNGFIVPYVVGSLTQGRQTLQQWKKVFYIGAAIYTFCGTFFAIFGSAELQPWNNIESYKTEEPACPTSLISSNTPEKRNSAEKNNS